MNSKHIAIIDPAVKTPELDCYNQINLSLGGRMTTSYHLPAMFGLDSLLAIEGQMSALVILGSATSVYEEQVWQKNFNEWLNPHLLSGKPVLGICYGHQLIAHLLGGRVEFLFPDKRKLQGFRKINFQQNKLFKAGDNSGLLYVSHRETVSVCPPNMRVFASSPEVAIEGLVHPKLPIYTVQAHPEATPVFLRNLKDTETPHSQNFDFGKQLLASFFNIVAST